MVVPGIETGSREISCERKRERLKVLFIQKHGRGLNRVPAHTRIEIIEREREGLFFGEKNVLSLFQT